MTTVDRPLKLGELLAESIRIYSLRVWAALGVGLVVAVSYLISSALHAAFGIALISLAFTVAYAATARLVAGDSFGAAWRQVATRLPVLVVLAFIVAVPFALAVGYLLLMLFAVGWLALTGFAIPVAMLEPAKEIAGTLPRLGYALRRAVTLARIEYIHAVGVAAALVIVYLLIGIVLAGALVGFADNGRVAAFVLVQLVLAPFFFIGLSVLYFDQKARALSSARQDR